MNTKVLEPPAPQIGLAKWQHQKDKPCKTLVLQGFLLIHSAFQYYLKIESVKITEHKSH